MSAPITEEIIYQLADMVCASLLNEPAQRYHGPVPSGAETICGIVHISGTFNGFVSVVCRQSLARKIGEILFKHPGAALSYQEMQDAMRELTNMIGGNIKGLLPEPSSLSLPVVAPQGQDTTFPDAVTVCRSDIQVMGEPIEIILKKQMPASQI
jgi:chemotaxis protein CheX